MRIGLFIPCYMDAFEHEAGVATLELLERLGCDVEYPVDQTCCGQPMTNTGCHQDAAAAEALFVKNFAGYDASSPFIPGICRSIRVTSGLSS
jgi:L-lactate dehydrogenase complex protein LldE